MCTSLDEGGTRCAQCYKPRFDALIAAMDKAVKSPFGADAERKKARDKYTVTTDLGVENALNVVANYASTGNGATAIKKVIALYTGKDAKTVAFLTTALKKGTERREETAAQVKEIKAEESRQRGSTTQIYASPKANATWSMQHDYPGVAEWWDHEKNIDADGVRIGPDQVTPYQNVDIFLTCPSGHSFRNRGNNITNPIKRTIEEDKAAAEEAGVEFALKTYYPNCVECSGRTARTNALRGLQQGALKDIAALLDNPEAFNVLAPAHKYEIFRRLGMLRTSDLDRQNLLLNIAYGNLSLDEARRAADYDSIAAKVADNLVADGDAALSTITDSALLDDTSDTRAGSGDRDETTIGFATDETDRLFDALGVLDMPGIGDDLADSIIRDTIEQMWRVASNTADAAEYAATLETLKDTSYFDRKDLVETFLAEFHTVMNAPLPVGYEPNRTDEQGAVVVKDPTVSQRRFIYQVLAKRRFFNFSGTGAGKTLSSVLAVHAAGARETLVVCPNPVKEQWEDEFDGAFPANTKIRKGLPKVGEEFPDLPEGVNRVWVINYEQFQKIGRALAPHLSNLNDRVDAIIFDEVHWAKDSKSTKMTKKAEKEASLRRAALLKFADRAREVRPDVVIIGASATPVVNNLDEAKSILRLVEGPSPVPFMTKPTLANAVAAYRRLSAAGVRHMPNYKARLLRHEERIDISENMVAVFAEIKKSARKRQNARPTALDVEQALLGEKMDTIVKIATAKAAKGERTVFYTHFVDGMVDPMVEALSEAGLRVGNYTGNEKPKDRRAILQQFRDGNLDVLVGSKPIGTGVDGLQHSAHTLVVVSMPWTAADDDQLVGRLHRHGQVNDVDVIYLLTEAFVGETKTPWSWDVDHRLKRVHFKRDIASAAVDGILPDGVLDTDQHSVDNAFDALTALLEPEMADVEVQVSAEMTTEMTAEMSAEGSADAEEPVLVA